MANRSLKTQTVPPKKLAHVVLRSRKFDEAVAWYKTVLGAEAMFENGFLAFLTYDDEHHRVAIISTPDAGEVDHTRAGLDHVAFTFAQLGDLLSTYQRLKEAGITPYWCINHGPTTSMYYRDPDGTQVELQIDNFATDEALEEWFETGAFNENPIGVNFDPDELARLYEAGEPLSVLTRQGTAKAG